MSGVFASSSMDPESGAENIIGSGAAAIKAGVGPPYGSTAPASTGGPPAPYGLFTALNVPNGRKFGLPVM